MKNRVALPVVLLIAIFSVFIAYQGGLITQDLPSFNPSEIFGSSGELERKDGYFTMVDEDGNTIHRTAHAVSVGDEYIASDNKHYTVYKLEKDTAYLKYIGMNQVAYNPAWDAPSTVAVGAIPAAKDQKQPLIGIYHTHSSESYKPTDGKESIYGKGGIFKVGAAYADALEKIGVKTIHDTRPHDPHDANAYARSRRTAVDLLKKNPIALVDVHRDAVPPDVYAGEVDGKEITKVKLVVGRRNPHKADNLQFAKDIKAYLDKNQPGVIEGIFIAKGNYNQDLAPHAILIEAGSYSNTREAAEAGVKYFAEAIPRVLGATPAEAGTPGGEATPGAKGDAQITPVASENRASWSSALWIIGIVAFGAIAFLLISTGSIKGSMDKMKQFTTKEFSNAFGIFSKAREKRRQKK